MHQYTQEIGLGIHLESQNHCMHKDILEYDQHYIVIYKKSCDQSTGAVQ